ncbi:serine/threonine-protein kinase pim-2-like [Colossoma macropomum]|uniref:serine/threonine-protein kinase pim-2-like n=1 Tax=Colossoma macropomum TaxID=42526 RepID=UPI00186483FF|nr:serine/threonine-protein kinase pim-2-like [Colossoma macropomum]
MVKTKELSEDIRSAIISKHKTSKGYKAISKDLGIPVSTVRNVIKKFACLSRTSLDVGKRGKLTREVFEADKTDEEILKLFEAFERRVLLKLTQMHEEFRDAIGRLLEKSTDAPRGKRKRKEEEFWTVPEGTTEVPNIEAPAGKRVKQAVNQSKRTSQGQEKATEPDAPRGKRNEEGCSQNVAERKHNNPNSDNPGKKGAENPHTRMSRGERTTTEPGPSTGLTTVNYAFASNYVTGEKLGKGGFGSVFKGRRISDGLQVAIKVVSKQETNTRYLRSPVDSRAVPAEVALMQMVNQPPFCKNIIRLIEWLDEPDQYILVLERPDPCVDLWSFLDNLGGYADEEMARTMMLQVVEAVSQCSLRGVLHRDIKLANLLINTDTSEVKLIDFGCGDKIKRTGYTQYKGTSLYCPPEFLLERRYHANPATVWSLGVLLFRMVCGYFPFVDKMDIVQGRLDFRAGLSQECRNLIEWCLKHDQSERPSFEQIRQHEWFQRTVQG